MQLLGADFGHSCMRGFLRMTGALACADMPPAPAAGAVVDAT